MVHSALGRSLMTTDSREAAPQFDGILDLDEPEVTAASGEACPPPEWTGDELLQIDVKGNIHVRGGRYFPSRVVGRVGGDDGEAVIAMLSDRFKALEERWKQLRKEVAGAHNIVRHLKSLGSFVHWVEGAEAIGDFEALLDAAHAEIDRLEGLLRTSRDIKRTLVAEAERAADSNQWRSTADEMNRLMDQWKQAGSGGGDEDEALWERFRTARSRFFDRRSEHTAEVKHVQREGLEAKEALIARAEALADSQAWDETFAEMQELMEAWKAAPSAGRKRDEGLWQRFHAARDPFFEARKRHFAEQRQSAGRRPEGRGRGHDRRPGRGRGPSAPPDSGRRPGQAGLHASLAELVGPLKGLFPSKDDDDS